jgi:hypothetical protein
MLDIWWAEARLVGTTTKRCAETGVWLLTLPFCRTLQKKRKRIDQRRRSFCVVVVPLALLASLHPLGVAESTILELTLTYFH